MELSQDRGGQVVAEKVAGDMNLTKGFFEEFVVGIGEVAHGVRSVAEGDAAATLPINTLYTR
jgi:hypothetical protein